jgi:type I restriction enzyme S subunit
LTATVRLKHLCSQWGEYGLGVSAEDYAAEGVRLIRTSDITDDGELGPTEGGVFVDPAMVDGLDLRTGDVLISRSGTLGRSLIFDEERHGKCTFAAYLVRFRLKDRFDPRFIYYFTKSSPFEQQIRLEATQATIANFNAQKLGNLELPDFPAERQATIGDFLDRETARIDELVRARNRLADLLLERSRAYSTKELLRGVDPTTGRAAHLPAGWRLARLATVVRLQRGHDLPDQLRRDGSVPVLSSGGISGYHDQAAAWGPGVVTGRYGTVGEVFWVEGPYWPLNTSLYVVSFMGNDPRWVYHLLRVTPLNVDAEKSAVTGINRNVVGQLHVPVPPLEEQRPLAALLDATEKRMNAARARIAEHIDLLKERRQSLITAAVTGQIDVSKRRGEGHR